MQKIQMAALITPEKRGRGVKFRCASTVEWKRRDYLQFYPVGKKIGKPVASRSYPVIVIGPFADPSTGDCHNGNARQRSWHSVFASGPKGFNMCRSERPFRDNVVSAFETSRDLQVSIREQFMRLIEELF